MDENKVYITILDDTCPKATMIPSDEEIKLPKDPLSVFLNDLKDRIENLEAWKEYCELDDK